MRPTRLFRGLTVVVALLCLGLFERPATAQGIVKAKYGDWELRCETPPGASREQCALLQSVAADDKPNINLVVIVLRTADGKSRLLRVIAPLGVLLPSGLGLKIDTTDVGRAGFVRCLPTGCVAEVVMEDKLIDQMRTGTSATFIIFQTPEEGIGIPLALKGFKEGFDALLKAPDRKIRIGALAIAGLALAGCSGVYSPDIGPSNKVANLLAFNSTSAPTIPAAPSLKPLDSCPEVVVIEGAAQRVFAGPAGSAENLKHQVTITDAARQCFLNGTQLTIKVGVEGRVLLGATGSPGTFTVPISLAVINEKTQATVVSKTYRISAVIAPGQSATDYSFVADPLVVPNLSDHPEDDYNIKLGIEGAGGAAVAEKTGRRRRS